MSLDTLRFADNFWNTQYTSTQGFDTLVKRMKDGRQVLKDIEDFVKQRAEIEKSYGSKLTRLAKNPGGKDEIGSMKQSWEQFVCQTEKIGEAHIAMSQVLLEEVKHIREFRDLQREKRKKIEDVILESQRQKKDTYNKTMTLKKSYDRNCREADNAEDLALKSRLTANAKEQEKLNLSKERKKTQAEQADQAYQRSIEHLEEIRKKWEKDFTQGCVIFQSLEEERIQFLRNALWIQTNIGSSYCCKEDQYYEDVRKLLEICDETKDIQQFIKNSNTGKVPPAPMQYENYYLPKINSKSAGRVGSIMKTQTSIGRRPQEPLPSSVVSTLRGTSTVATRGPPPLPVQNNSMDFEDDPAYASVSDKTEKLVKALYAYEAQGERELSFEVGDIITVTDQNDENWWEGKCNGMLGMFPTNYVESAPPNLSMI